MSAAANIARKAIRGLDATQSLIDRLIIDPGCEHITDQLTGWQFFAATLRRVDDESAAWWAAVGIMADVIAGRTYAHTVADVTTFTASRAVILDLIDTEIDRHRRPHNHPADPFEGLT